MKNQVFDRFSRVGRLRSRLDEIVAQVERGELPRMDGGDLIARHIVASLVAQTQRSDEANQLLFDAQRSRAQLYLASSGATPIEAADALIEARGVLGEDEALLLRCGELADLAEEVLEALIAANCRRHAWSVFQVMDDALPRGGPEVEALATRFIRMCEAWMEDLAPSALGCALELLDQLPTAGVGEELRQLLPAILKTVLGSVDTDLALRAYQSCHDSDIALEASAHRELARTLIEAGRADEAPRAVYTELLREQPTSRVKIESDLRRLAYVDPNPKSSVSADVSALNELFSEFYSEAPWYWQNRALLYRHQGDLAAALACLARAMNMSGNPPELMGLLSPLLAGLGFVEAARAFARFLPEDVGQELGVSSILLLDREPNSRREQRDAESILAIALEDPRTPPEFRPVLQRRRAELLLQLGESVEARRLLEDLLREQPQDVLARVRLVEAQVALGDCNAARAALEEIKSDRVLPICEYLRSRLVEMDGNLNAAAGHNDRARHSLQAARRAGRDAEQKFLVVLADRIERLVGAECVDGVLMSMLRTECHTRIHPDLERLAPALERRAIDLAMRIGDVDTAREVVEEFVRQRPAETGIFMVGIRASLRSHRLDDARDFLRRAEAIGCGESAETHLVRGLIAVAEEEREDAEDWFRRSLDAEPGDEAALALAAMRIDAGCEQDALDILNAAAKVDVCEAAQRERLLLLRGKLLERSERSEDALQSYLQATRVLEGWTESRHRAGLLAIRIGHDEQGRMVDERLVTQGIRCLEGFNDPASVTHSAVAKASVASNRESAVAVLGTALRRVSGRSWCCLAFERLEFLMLCNDDEASREQLDALLAEPSLSESEAAEAHRIQAEMRRRSLLTRVVNGAEGEELAQVLAAFEATSELHADETSRNTLNLLRAIGDESRPLPELDERTPDALVLVRALAAIPRGIQEVDKLRIDQVARMAESVLHGDVARLILGVAPARQRVADLRSAIASMEALGAELPFARGALLQRMALKALDVEAPQLFHEIVENEPKELRDLEALRSLMIMAEGKGASDPTRLLGVLHHLDRSVGGEERKELADLRQRISALKETPSDAWASAKLRAAGRRARVGDDEVLAYWRSRCEDDPSGEALHHAALIELARAHESEASSDSKAAADWAQAHESWNSLINHERFWTQLAERVEAELPEQGANAVMQCARDNRPLAPESAHRTGAQSSLCGRYPGRDQPGSARRKLGPFGRNGRASARRALSQLCF